MPLMTVSNEAVQLMGKLEGSRDGASCYWIHTGRDSRQCSMYEGPQGRSQGEEGAF
jgi:hypothetical protein